MIDNPFSLQDYTIVVTGASSGIGRECAILFSQMGANLILIGRNQLELTKTLELTNNNNLHTLIQLDLTDYHNVDEFVNSLIEKKIKIQGIVHAAGISTTLPLRNITPEKLDVFFKTNVIAAINLTKLLTKNVLVSDFGLSIVFLASVMGLAGEKGKTQYSLTKGALIAGAKSLALELASKNIRVNCVAPGVVVTPMSENAVYAQNEESLNSIKNLHPLGLGTPHDVANACVYLLSPASRWVTGTTLIVDGGYLAK
jgi:NAD(P)-dependent dehydrogenase (short-subunit alcohol dehydrogenase family)